MTSGERMAFMTTLGAKDVNKLLRDSAKRVLKGKYKQIAKTFNNFNGKPYLRILLVCYESEWVGIGLIRRWAGQHSFRALALLLVRELVVKHSNDRGEFKLNRYSLTPLGREMVEDLLLRLDERCAEYLESLREFEDFKRLL